MANRDDKKSAGIGRGTPGPGRGKGTPNHLTKDVRQMIAGALDAVGGMEYLAARAVDQPVAFMALVGRTIPKEIRMDLAVSIAERLRRAEGRVAGD